MLRHRTISLSGKVGGLPGGAAPRRHG